MTSDFGKIFDPIADKLTQGVIMLCLSFKYKLMCYFVGVFVVKEIIMFVMGAIVYKKDDSFNSARWYGKANTVLIYLTIALLILMPEIKLAIANALIITCICTCVLSLVLYACFYSSILRRRKKINQELALTKTEEIE
jgi:cardiolipin synthase